MTRNRDKPLRSRIRALEEAAQAERKPKPTLLLKTYDGGVTFGGPDDKTYTEGDLPRLEADYKLLVIEYVQDWKSPGPEVMV